MSLLKNMSFWIFICATISATSYFADYLLTPESRRKQRYKVHIFFRKLFDSIDKTNFNELQRLLVTYVIRFKYCLFGERLFSRKMLIMSLLCSQYLTLTALILSILTDVGKSRDLNIFCIIPLFPFFGFSFFISQPINVYRFLHSVGLFWNNYLFDFLAIASTVILLKMAYEKKLWFSLAAFIDVILSYLLAYFCIIFYYIMPPNSGYLDLRFLSFIPDMWNGRVPSMLHHTPWLFYSLTTFVPVLFYMSVLLFLSICKCLQYVCAPLVEKCSTVGGRTIFFTFGSAFAILAILLTAIKEFIN